jgi:hypothetical protein
MSVEYPAYRMTVYNCVYGRVCSDKAVLSAAAWSENEAYKFTLISTDR